MRRLALLLCIAAPAQGQIALSANDGKQVLVDGVQTVPERPEPDSVSVLSLSEGAPRVLATIHVPTSIIGPPSSIAIGPKGAFALVTSARRLSETDPRQLVPDDRVTMIDLRSTPPRVLATARAGAGASGVSINSAGTLALIANRAEGTLSVFDVSRDTLAKIATIKLGDATSAPAHAIFFDRDRRALVTRDGDHRISLLRLDGQEATLLPETLRPGLRPYEITTAGDQAYAVSANIGGAGRDIDTISLIELSGEIPRVIDVAAVGLTPEGIRMAPDGRHIAITVNNGSNSSPESPLYNRSGRLQIWKIVDGRLRFVCEAPMGGWGQGVAWSPDGRRIYAQAVVERRIESFTFNGRRLVAGPALAFAAGPAAIAAAGR